VNNIFRSLKNKFFKKKGTVPRGSLNAATEVSTAPLTEAELGKLAQKKLQIEPQQLIYGVGRNIGCIREVNEDSIFSFTAIIDSNGSSMPFGIYMVADGMGGHQHGELASEIAIRALSSYLLDQLNEPFFGPEPFAPEESLQEILRLGVQYANDHILRSVPEGGTTLTAVILIGTQMTLAHVGDSRAYAVFLDGRIQQLTRDHSLVKRLEELGQITAEEASNHPQKSMLYNALGQGGSPRPDIFTAILPHPGFLMLCSDGLWGVVSEDDIFSIITSAPNLQRACQNMVDAAISAGGPDNISVVLARLSD